MEIETTEKPLFLSHDPGLDWLVAVEFGAVVDGKADEECVPIDEHRAFVRSDVGGPVIGFVLNRYSAYDPADHPELFEGHRFDVPVLGLEGATVNEIVLSARATFGPLPTADVVLFDLAVNGQGGDTAEAGWRAYLASGNLKAHFGLGYTLWELGRFREGVDHVASGGERALERDRDGGRSACDRPGVGASHLSSAPLPLRERFGGPPLRFPRDRAPR